MRISIFICKNLLNSWGAMHSQFLLLRKLLAEYEGRDEEFRDKVFPEAVVFVLRALKLDEMAAKVEANPKLAYPVAKKLVEDYFTMRNDVLVEVVALKRFLEMFAESGS